MNSETKLCVNCEHFKSLFALCGAPQNGIDIVNGGNKAQLASINRSPALGSYYACGQDAQWFKMKECQSTNKSWWNFWS